MYNLKIYTSCKGIAKERFDVGNINSLINLLKDKYDIELIENIGDGSFIYRDVPITHGSILIFEFEDGTFKTYEFGDYPKLTIELSSHRGFIGAAIGQYNKSFWDSIIDDTSLRNKIKVGPYAETYWNFGKNNHDAIQTFRKNTVLDDRLYWRGSLYTQNVDTNYIGVRKSVELLPLHLNNTELSFNPNPIPFMNYIYEMINYRIVLSIGGGGGISCGDYCFRDIELMGLGIPMIRPKYTVEHITELIPNVHYISVDTEFEANGRYKNHNLLSENIANRYREVIKDTDYLNEVGKNGYEWYMNNMVYPNITHHLINALEL